MSLWNDIINSPIGGAIADGLKTLFRNILGVLLFFSSIGNVYLLQDSHERVSPQEHARVLWKLDSCEVHRERERILHTKDMLTAQTFFSKESERRDSISYTKDLEIARLNFIIKQYEKTAKQ